jgi:hypothetical protein
MPYQCSFDTRNSTIGVTCECSRYVLVQLLIVTLANLMPSSEHIHPLSSCLAKRMDPSRLPTGGASQPSSKRHLNIVAACRLSTSSSPPATFTQLEPLSCLCYSALDVIRFLSSHTPPSVGYFSAPSPITSSNTRPLHIPDLAFCLKPSAPQYSLRVPLPQLQASSSQSSCYAAQDAFMMSGEAWLYLLAVLINAVNLFLQVFFTIMYSDLEW